MSKPVVRIVLALLISLVIVAAITPSVRAKVENVLAGSNTTSESQNLGQKVSGGAFNYHFKNFDAGSRGGCDYSDPYWDD